MYTREFVELYNKKNPKLIYEIREMIKLEKIYVSTAKNHHNLSTHWNILILLILLILI